MIIKKEKLIFRGGSCKLGNAFYALDYKTAKMYGGVCTFKPKRNLKLFEITHSSLKNVFRHLTENTRILLAFAFGTGILKKNQNVSLKRLIGHNTRRKIGGLGQRVSITDIDDIAIKAFAKEFLNKNGYDGAFMPRKKSVFHKNFFHREIFISKNNLLTLVSSQPQKTVRKSSSKQLHVPITELFVRYTKHTQRLLKPHPRKFVMYLSGGMAVKLYLRARGIKTAKTSDFDFKCAVPHVLHSQKQIDTLAEYMRRIMTRHVSGFVNFLNRNGIQSNFECKELKGVPLDKPGGTLYKKVYKVFNFTIITPQKRYELVDTSLVLVPGITRQNISLKWSRFFGMPIQTLKNLWKDTLYVLAGSFVIDKIKLRNPINGDKKEKGIKNAIRTGHLSFLKPGRTKLVSLSRKLIENIIRRNKKSGITHSKMILKQLH